MAKSEEQRTKRDQKIRMRYHELIQQAMKDRMQDVIKNTKIYLQISEECMHSISPETVRKIVNGYV